MKLFYIKFRLDAAHASCMPAPADQNCAAAWASGHGARRGGRETYVACNLQKLDRLRDDEPKWVEYYSTEISENVLESMS